MSYWDSSALIKLYVQEFDSAAFRALAANATRVVTASLTRHEMRTVFRRREAEGILLSGEAAVLYGELNADIAAADIVIQPETVDVEREFGVVLEKCFSQSPAAFIRTNDALHLASAKVAGELEFVTSRLWRPFSSRDTGARYGKPTSKADQKFEVRFWSAELHRIHGVLLGAMGAKETEIEAALRGAISIAKQQKANSLLARAETTYAEYRRQKAVALGNQEIRLPLW